MNNEDWVTIEPHLVSAFRETVKQFQDHPADFLSECDIQAVMFAGLRNELSHLRMHYVASCDKDKCLGESLEISRVLTEHQISPEGHCDIAILCSDQDTSAPNIWEQPCRIGIEIKLWQALEYHNWNEPRGPQKDVEKLQRYWMKRLQDQQHFTGIAMLFRHPGAFSCREVDGIAGTDYEFAFPENGVAIHVISNEGHRWNMAPDSRPLAVTTPTTV